MLEQGYPMDHGFRAPSGLGRGGLRPSPCNPNPGNHMPRGSAREFVLKVRLSEGEHDRLTAVAAVAGKTVADVIRADAGRMTVRDIGTERARVAMLNRINANLNMIARWANMHKAGADAVRVIAELAAVERAVRALVERHDG